jgi:TRAP-type C4-dicarboxylate transport system substrate-binding protein
MNAHPNLIGTVALMACLAWAVTWKAEASDTAVFKIATVAPVGSSFDKRLQALSAEWARGPGGARMDVFAGYPGGELQYVRRMRARQLNGAMLTTTGLAQIDRSVTALQYMPMMFRSWEEVDVVRERLRPELERRLRQAGYVVLLWGDAGWVRYFSREPIHRISDMRDMTIMASDGDPESIEMMKDYYRPKVLEPDQIQLGLRNRMIDGVPVPAFLANFLQLGRYAPYMVDLRWAPITGALVVRATDWDRLEPATQAWILKACEDAGRDIRRASREEDEAAVRAMQQKQGLTVVSLSAEAEAEWRSEVERMYPRIRGTLVPEGMFDAAVEALREYRQSQP